MTVFAIVPIGPFVRKRRAPRIAASGSWKELMRM